MGLDLVHDIQTVYRKVVDAMSRPGIISDLGEEAGKLAGIEGCLPSTLLLAIMLLDTEVTFKVVSPQEAHVTDMINSWTYAKSVSAEEADYLFILQDAAADEAEHALKQAKIGELEEPHHAATLIVEAGSLTAGHVLTLSGPGIQQASEAQVSLSFDWAGLREIKNTEYPLGVDFILVDSNHRLLGVPRTTRIRKEAVC